MMKEDLYNKEKIISKKEINRKNKIKKELNNIEIEINKLKISEIDKNKILTTDVKDLTKNNEFESEEHWSVKKRILMNFIKSCTPEKQGSPEWLYKRKMTIGGSEQTDIHRFSKQIELIARKIDLEKFEGNVSTRWGTMFENVIRMYCDQRFQTHIYEVGSVRGSIKYSSHSPDGLSTINKENVPFNYFAEDETELEDEKELNILWEFKCPRSRVPNGEIPHHYTDQLPNGLAVIPHPIIDMGIFCDACFRICTLWQMFTPSYKELTYQNRSKYSSAYAYGFVGISDEFDQYIDDFDNLVDFGECNENDIDNLIEKITLHKLIPYYIVKSIETFDLDVELAKFDEFCRTKCYKLLGVLPFKLCDVHFMPVYRQKNFLQDRSPIMKLIMEKVEYLNSIPLEERTGVYGDVVSKMRREAFYPELNERRYGIVTMDFEPVKKSNYITNGVKEPIKESIKESIEETIEETINYSSTKDTSGLIKIDDL